MIFRRLTLLIITAASLFTWSVDAPAQDKKVSEAASPIKALLVTGGCSHDYTSRKAIIVQGIRERVSRPIEWMVKHQGDGESDARIPLFESAEWAKGYDIVVHDHCFPRVREGDYVDRILAPHRAGLPAVLIHGTMLSFQLPDNRWSSFTGATIRGHDREGSLRIEPLAPANPILKKFQPWIISLEELYRVESLASGATALIGAKPHPPATDNPMPAAQAVAWSHLYGPAKAKIFATTIGNEVSTLMTPAYLDLVARGFLWAINDLSDTSFLTVPPDQSLPGLKIALPPGTLPETGPNPAREGNASALASGASEGTSPDRAIDGDANTYWESDAPGPASWQVELTKATPVGAVALIWKEPRPVEFLIEGSADGRSWERLASGGEGAGETTLSVLSLNPVKWRHLRVSIPVTQPGHVPGIREFAAYPGMDEVPSGLVHGWPAQETEPRLLTAGKSGFERKIRLAPGWSIAASLPWGDGDPVQLIPTASGKVFLLTDSAAGETKNEEPSETRQTERMRSQLIQGTQNSLPTRSVHLLDRSTDGSIQHSLYLDGLAPGTVVSWDGEWLYTLSGGKLDAFRHVSGDGPANERYRAGTVFSLPAGTSLDAIEFSGMELGFDGWFYARFRSPQAWEAYDSRGVSVQLPDHGVARFRRNGEGFSQWNDAGKGRGAAETDDFGVQQMAKVDGFKVVARDGSSLWTALKDSEGTTLACIEKSTDEPATQVRWDDLHASVLFDFLGASRPSVRREALAEILRRKRDPASDLEALLAIHSSSELTTSLLSALTFASPERSLKTLVQMVQSSDPDRQALAFHHLGDHPLGRNHPIFQQITTITSPAVTIEILRSMLRSDTEIKGIDELALSFTAHPDPELALAAREFLIAREASAACFEALDGEGRKEHWRGAFDVLAALKRPTIVEGIALRLEQTGSAEFRRLGLEALCRLYYRDDGKMVTWEGTRLAEVFLMGSLSDHRVDRPVLLDTMIAFSIPLPEPDLLVDLAKADLALESLAVNTIVAAGKPVSPAVSTWLEGITKSSSRDNEMRTKARSILAGTQQSEVEMQSLPHVSELTVDAVIREVERVESKAEDGRGHFNRLACDTCHNIHGEGPSSAPDLATAVARLAPGPLIEAILDPAKEIKTGFEMTRFELTDGRQLTGFVEERTDTSVAVRDLAGNSFSLTVAEIHLEWADGSSPMPCDAAGDLTLPEFAALIEYLRTLSTGS